MQDIFFLIPFIHCFMSMVITIQENYLILFVPAGQFFYF